MTWYLYGTILVCSYVNWGGFITSQNKRKDFAVNYHFISINFSEKDLLKYADEKHDQKLKNRYWIRLEMKVKNLSFKDYILSDH
jgi:hypothetical protein